MLKSDHIEMQVKENRLTDDVSEGQRFAEEIAIGPPVVVFEIVDEIVEQ